MRDYPIHWQPAIRPTFFRRLIRWGARVVLVMVALIGAGVGWFFWNRPRPTAPAEIFQGVVYSCERLSPDAEGTGQGYFLDIDLTRPGFEMYATPLDSQAVAQGWEYRLRWTPTVCKEENLSVAINATLFIAENGKLRLPGIYARSCDTVIADHQVNRVDPNSYLLWFDDHLQPHLEKGKPPPPAALLHARYGISGQMVVLDQGKPNRWASHEPEAQMLAGIDPARRILFLAAFDNASLARATRILASHGAVDAISLDGGGSASMVVGKGAKGLGATTLLWPRRAVATHFGIRAQEIEGNAKQRTTE